MSNEFEEVVENADQVRITDIIADFALPGTESLGAALDDVGVDRIAAQYDTDTLRGFRFQLVNGDVTPPRPYAMVEVVARHGGFEFGVKVVEGASELEQRSVRFIAASPAHQKILMEMTGRALQSAPDPESACKRLLRMDCGAPYPVRLEGKHEGMDDDGTTVIISIWNAAVTPPKRVATLRRESLRRLNRVIIEDHTNGPEERAIYELQDPDRLRQVMAEHQVSPELLG